MEHVLVVDDDPTIRQVVGEALAEEGYRVAFAHSGRSTLVRLETERTDLVILDLRMPDGDGIQTLGTMKSQPHLSNIPVVVITTGEFSTSVDDATAVLLKPFDLDHLMHLVRETIGPAT